MHASGEVISGLVRSKSPVFEQGFFFAEIQGRDLCDTATVLTKHSVETANYDMATLLLFRRVPTYWHSVCMSGAVGLNSRHPVPASWWPRHYQRCTQSDNNQGMSQRNSTLLLMPSDKLGRSPGQGRLLQVRCIAFGGTVR
jgi:hypothetical protein